MPSNKMVNSKLFSISKCQDNTMSTTAKCLVCITKYLKFLAATCNGQAHSRGEEKSFLLFVKNITGTVNF